MADAFRRSRGAFGILLVTLASSPAGAGAPDLAVTVEKTETLLFDHGAQACETWDIPDTPTRAFRGADGKLHVFQTTFRNRPLVGETLDTLRHDCAVAFEGSDDADPASFDHRGWIASTWTPDGRTVFGIVHDEFHGERFGAPCPSTGEPLACWYNALTAVVSRDGGATFRPTRPRLVAAIPFRAEETQGDHAGYFEPTNIVSHDGALFMMANVVSPPPQRSGNCLLRTDRIEDPTAWRGFRDGRFSVRFADPYGETIDRQAHLCDPIAPEVLRWPVTSLVRHGKSGLWIAIMKGRTKGGDGRERSGVFYATSRDLIRWNGPELALEAPIAGGCGAADAALSYPALIDPDSSDRNFGAVGDRPMLTFVRTRGKDCEAGPDRDVVMRRVSISASVSGR